MSKISGQRLLLEPPLLVTDTNLDVLGLASLVIPAAGQEMPAISVPARYSINRFNKRGAAVRFSDDPTLKGIFYVGWGVGVSGGYGGATHHTPRVGSPIHPTNTMVARLMVRASDAAGVQDVLKEMSLSDSDVSPDPIRLEGKNNSTIFQLFAADGVLDSTCIGLGYTPKLIPIKITGPIIMRVSDFLEPNVAVFDFLRGSRTFDYKVPTLLGESVEDRDRYETNRQRYEEQKRAHEERFSRRAVEILMALDSAGLIHDAQPQVVAPKFPTNL